MTYDCNYKITTVEDAWEFARFLVLDLQVEYNPGDDFGNYLDENGKPYLMSTRQNSITTYRSTASTSATNTTSTSWR